MYEPLSADVAPLARGDFVMVVMFVQPPDSPYRYVKSSLKPIPVVVFPMFDTVAEKLRALPVVPDVGRPERLLEVRLIVFETEHVAPAFGDTARVPFVQRYAAEPVVGAVLSVTVSFAPLATPTELPVHVFPPTVHVFEVLAGQGETSMYVPLKVIVPPEVRVRLCGTGVVNPAIPPHVMV